jgi:hypothetical protein
MVVDELGVVAVPAPARKLVFVEEYLHLDRLHLSAAISAHSPRTPGPRDNRVVRARQRRGVPLAERPMAAVLLDPHKRAAARRERGRRVDGRGRVQFEDLARDGHAICAGEHEPVRVRRLAADAELDAGRIVGHREVAHGTHDGEKDQYGVQSAPAKREGMTECCEESNRPWTPERTEARPGQPGTAFHRFRRLRKDANARMIDTEYKRRRWV